MSERRGSDTERRDRQNGENVDSPIRYEPGTTKTITFEIKSRRKMEEKEDRQKERTRRASFPVLSPRTGGKMGIRKKSDAEEQ